MIHTARVQYKFEEADKINSDLAVKFHGAAMEFISPQNAMLLHNGRSHPVSVYTTVKNNIVTLNAFSLTNQMSDFVEFFYKMSEVKIFGAERPAVKISSQRADFDFLSSIDYSSGGLLRLEFITPAMFKQNHKPCFIPSPERYFSSVISKLNEYEKTDIKVDDFICAWNSSRVTDYNLTSRSFNVTGLMLKGMMGSISIRVSNDEKKSHLLKTVLSYAQYSGAGAKTAQGMGGFILSQG